MHLALKNTIGNLKRVEEIEQLLPRFRCLSGWLQKHHVAGCRIAADIHLSPFEAELLGQTHRLAAAILEELGSLDGAPGKRSGSGICGCHGAPPNRGIDQV
jgi:hypothetical protein